MPPAACYSDDEDSISLTSTTSSDQQEEYEVETILSQRTIEGTEYYLVKWEGYPYERCTWEPEESFCDPITLKEWREKSAAIARGDLPEFDVQSLEDRACALEQASLERKGRRRAKRFRLGLLLSPTDDNKDEQEEEYEVDSLFDSVDENEPSRPQNKSKKPPTQRSTQPTSQPRSTSQKTAGVKRLSAVDNRKKSNFPRSPLEGPGRGLSNPEPYRPIPKRQLAKRTNLPPAIGISAGASKNSISRIRQRKEHSFDPTDPARVKMFKNLSSKWRYEKATRREPAPDISQLDLRRPGEWLTSSGGSNVPARSGLWNHNYNGPDSLFVEQDGPMPTMFEEPRFIGGSPTTTLGERSSGGLRRQISLDGGNTTNRSQQRNPEQETPLGAQRKSSLEFSYSSTTALQMGEKPPFRQYPSQGDVVGRKFGAQGRYWDPGEVLVTIRFGTDGREIGHVRLCNLDLRTKRQILDTKEGKNIDIWFRDTCTIEQYSLICERQGNKNIKYSNGWALGFPDTSSALSDFAGQLRERNHAALWYHPQSMNAATLVAYASGSSGWGFFDADARFPKNITLKIVSRSSLPPLSSLPPIISPKPPLLSVPNQPAPIIEQANEHVTKPEDTIMQEALHEDHKVMEITVKAHTGDIAKVFQEHFEFTYNELAEVNISSKTDRHAHAFYLQFPDHAQAEFELMVLFLRKNKAVSYSSRNEDDWEKFTRTVQNGTVIFHKDFTSYEKMPHLNALLRKQINIFNISLSTPIEYTSDRDHIERLFPHGGVILLTEDFIRHELDNAIVITGWFRGYISSRSPGTWKMYLRPDIQRWLLEMSKQSEDDRYLKIWSNIRRLIPDYPLGHQNFDRSFEEAHSLDGDSDAEGNHHPLVSASHLPDYGQRTENDHHAIPKGLTQEERDTDHLVECFAGWCWLHAPRFRRYIVLTHVKPQPRWKKWFHITIMRPEDFMKEFKVTDPDEKQSLSSRPKPTTEKTSSKDRP